jgi:hypothetical protein
VEKEAYGDIGRSIDDLRAKMAQMTNDFNTT